MFEEVLDAATPSITSIDVSIFLAPPNTSVDQNPDPMSDVDENLLVVPPHHCTTEDICKGKTVCHSR